jgi:PPIC-type PPIASE domain
MARIIDLQGLLNVCTTFPRFISAERLLCGLVESNMNHRSQPHQVIALSGDPGQRKTFGHKEPMVRCRFSPKFLPLLLRKVSSSMIRIFISLLLTGAGACAQTAGASQVQAPTQSSPAQPTAPPGVQQQSFNPDNVAPDAAVVVIHGVCLNSVPAKTGSAKADSCQTVITKDQFNAMLAGMNLASQLPTPAAKRNFAESYAQLLAMAAAGEKAAAENDPRFQELMRVARIRALADFYRHGLDEKYSNPSQEEIEAYYKENISKYESFKVERIIIPSINPGRTPAARAEYDKKFQKIANDIHERAARGEETQKLQDEVYKNLSLPSPPKTDLGMKRKGGLPAGIEKDLFALKPGEVTRLEAEMSGLNIYKLRSQDTIPVESVKGEIVRDLHQKNMEAAVKAVTGSVHSEMNDQFFGPTGGKGGPILRMKQPSDTLYPGGITTATPISPSAPGAAPVSPGNAMPAGTPPSPK